MKGRQGLLSNDNFTNRRFHEGYLPQYCAITVIFGPDLQRTHDQRNKYFPSCLRRKRDTDFCQTIMQLMFYIMRSFNRSLCLSIFRTGILTPLTTTKGHILSPVSYEG